MMAAAAVAARTFLQILLRGNAAQFDRLADELLNSLLQLVHLFLGVNEPFADWIVQESVPLRVERSDFAVIQGKALMLAFVERAALLAQALVLLLRGGVRHETFDAPADALELGLLNDAFAQFQGFLAHRILNLSICLHKVI
jgi:hypothetical protein